MVLRIAISDLLSLTRLLTDISMLKIAINKIRDINNETMVRSSCVARNKLPYERSQLETLTS